MVGGKAGMKAGMLVGLMAGLMVDKKDLKVDWTAGLKVVKLVDMKAVVMVERLVFLKVVMMAALKAAWLAVQLDWMVGSLVELTAEH